MAKDVLIIAHYTNDFNNEGNNRLNYIAKLISSKNKNTELVTSDFSHKKKIKREKNINNIEYKVTFINEPIYKRNISLKRFYSHYIMSQNLKQFLKNRKKPDVIYCAVPSLDVASVVAKYALDNHIRFIIDIQDLWPEAFKMVFNIPFFSKVMLYPMKKQADFVYASADEIIGVSQTYIERALKVNKKCGEGHSIFLGTHLEKFDRVAELNKITTKPKNEVWLTYIGTLSHSYDIKLVIDAIYILQQKGIANLKFLVVGDGGLKDSFKEYAKKKGVYTEFTGNIEYAKMAAILKVSDIAINPIKRGSAGSILNKVGDYAAAGLPVLNTQENLEYRNLLDKYEAGINCKNEDVIDLAKQLLYLYSNSSIRREMGNNNRKLAEEKFDRQSTYKKIIEKILYS